MKCAFDYCRKNARAGLYGSVCFGRVKITFPVCELHWHTVGRMQEKFEGTKKEEVKSDGKKRKRKGN